MNFGEIMSDLINPELKPVYKIKYDLLVIRFIESFVEIKLFHEKNCTVTDLFLELQKLWPASNIDNFRSMISKSLILKVSENDKIFITRETIEIIDPWTN